MLAGEGGLLQIRVASFYSRPAILLVVRLYKWYVVKIYETSSTIEAYDLRRLHVS